MVDLTSIKELNDELQSAINNFESLHSEMDWMRRYYKNSAFYPTVTGQAQQNQYLKANLLKVFADKNIHYTAPFPTIKVPTPPGDETARQNASIREKICLAVHQKSGTEILQKNGRKMPRLIV